MNPNEMTDDIDDQDLEQIAEQSWIGDALSDAELQAEVDAFNSKF